MNNFTELKTEELASVDGGFVVSTAFVVIVAVELIAGAATQVYLNVANQALDAKMKKY